MHEVSTPSSYPPQEVPPTTSHRRKSRDPRPKRLGDRSVRRSLVLLAVLPATVVSVIWVAAALAAFHGSMSGIDHTSGVLVLAGTLALICCVVLGAVFSATAQERAIAVRATARQASLSRFAVHGHARVAELLHQVVHQPPPYQRRADALPTSSGPAFDSLIDEIAAAQLGVEAAVLEMADQFHNRADPPARPVVEQPAEHGERRQPVAQPEPAGRRHEGGDRQREPGGSPEQFEVFANLSHRLQSLVHREIGLLDELENGIEDPDLLKSIFQVDHLATRIRRYAENLAVLGGSAPSRQWTRSISIGDVLRSAIAEVEQYSRVKLVPPIAGTVRGHAVVDIVHLLAELAENATKFSAPDTQVLLRVQRVTAGLAIEVEDRGLGLEPAERTELNRLLADPEMFVLGETLLDGRIGLYVVSSLARQHGISIQLHSNIYGGTQAVLVLPHDIQGEEPTHEPRTRIVAEPRKEPELRPSQPQQDHGPGVAASSGLPSRSTSVEAALPAEGPPTAMPLPAAPLTVSRRSRAASRESRPVLPTRVRQESLAPELRDRPAAEAPAPDEAEHDPGLVAAFLTGTRRAEKDADVSGDPRKSGGEDDHGE